MSNPVPTAAAAAPSADAWLTATNLVLIGIGVVLALLVIWWGARLKRQRKVTEAVIEDQAESARPAPLASVPLDSVPPPAPETDPVPVAPAPRPLADTPVVAAAPFDAAPATIAADLATSPEPSASSDDLTRMKGVGPKLAARLGELGVTRFAQIAALSPDEAATLDAQLGAFQGRIARDRWVEQAGYLARDDRAGFEAAFGRL